MIFDDFEQVHLFLSSAMPHGILDSSLTIQRFIIICPKKCLHCPFATAPKTFRGWLVSFFWCLNTFSDGIWSASHILKFDSVGKPNNFLPQISPENKQYEP